jgi:hypothetical protein
VRSFTSSVVAVYMWYSPLIGRSSHPKYLVLVQDMSSSIVGVAFVQGQGCICASCHALGGSVLSKFELNSRALPSLLALGNQPSFLASQSVFTLTPASVLTWRYSQTWEPIVPGLTARTGVRRKEEGVVKRDPIRLSLHWHWR